MCVYLHTMKEFTIFVVPKREKHSFGKSIQFLIVMAVSYNINEFLFTRVSPQKKVEVVNNLSEEELHSVTTQTIIRIIKEVGTGKPRGQNKVLRIKMERRTGNDWNSEFESIEIFKKELFVSLYVQYYNTDKTTCAYCSHFFARGDYKSYIEYTDRNGNKHTCNYSYTDSDKARCIRSVLLEYLFTKYAGKLNS